MSRYKPWRFMARFMERIRFGRGAVVNEGHISGAVASLEHEADRSHVTLDHDSENVLPPRIVMDRQDGESLERTSADHWHAWFHLDLTLADGELKGRRWRQLPYAMDIDGINRLSVGGVVEHIDCEQHEVTLLCWHGLRRVRARVYVRDLGRFSQPSIRQGERVRFEGEISMCRHGGVELVSHGFEVLKPVLARLLALGRRFGRSISHR